MFRADAAANGLGAAVVLGVLLLVTACSGTSARPGSIHVTPNGRIGPLRIGLSRRQQVIAFAGRPSAETRGRYFDYAPFDALGYDCPGHAATNDGGQPACNTVYYLLARTGQLVLLFTRDPRYAYRGVHPGTATTVAENTFHTGPDTGCYTGFAFGKDAPKAGTLVMEVFVRSSLSAGFPGGAYPRDALEFDNSQVGFLALQSANQDRRRNPGVLDCIDS